MPQDVIIVWKRQGQTPLEAIQGLSKQRPELAQVPMTYAGRLDPLASGVLVILVGDECLKKDEYLALPKEYEVEVLFGFETDTYDVLGKVDFSPPAKGEMPKAEGVHPTNPDRPRSPTGFAGEEIQSILKNFTGKISQKYPPYSSRTVNGKPLHQWAREGKVHPASYLGTPQEGNILLPSHAVFVESIEVLVMSEITGEKLLQKIIEDISRVNPKSDFRQEEILKLWEETLHTQESKKENYQTVKLKIVCGSGFYARVFAHDLGSALGIPALALNILRTRVGEYVC
jgi:tRNA U55 pseudouridine synthase TruB